ncbi:ABC transporter permease [Halocella sp. SP3-1]|uniref:ABC transporter permease n=1 Tax=Halocella sp. SP3-1 TaxID=2382161 RepID=UPI000F758ABA|nr:ABC transporter permease [Halocella sp. SP3-1]AZO95446.1 ABC transporter permease [Halocella sp. SP3-1]
MNSLVYTELLKMKNSKMFLLSLLGGIVSPLLTFFMLLAHHQQNPAETLTMKSFLSQTHLFIAFLVGTMLFALITTYLFNREFEEDTLKNLLTIPVGRTQLVLSKLFILIVWIEIIMIYSFFMVILLGLIGGFEGFQTNILLLSFKKYIFTGFLLYLLTPVITLITILFRTYIPSIAFSIFATLATLVIMNSKYIALYPWGIPVLMTMNNQQSEYPILISWLIIIGVFIISLTATLIYFNKTDID